MYWTVLEKLISKHRQSESVAQSTQNMAIWLLAAIDMTLYLIGFILCVILLTIFFRIRHHDDLKITALLWASSTSKDGPCGSNFALCLHFLNFVMNPWNW